MNYSYERVSTTKQDERRQELAFNGIKINKRYIDKVSGKSKDRPQLNKLMLEAAVGDNIYCESISRLGRNVDDLRELCKYFKDKGITIHFIKEGFNTTGDMYKFMLTILGAVAEMERELIVDRVKEGIEKAKIYGTKSGKSIGRPERILPNDFEKYYSKWKNKKITAVEFSKLIVVSRATLYRYIEKYEAENPIKKADDSKVAKIRMWIVIENNNKFVRGRKKVIEGIESFLKSCYDLKECDYPSYVIQLEYTTIEELTNEVYEILQELNSEADFRNCFMEADVRCDELDLYW